MDTFKNYQLENNEIRNDVTDDLKVEENSEGHVYFPKFLTSSSLTELQLR